MHDFLLLFLPVQVISRLYTQQERERERERFRGREITSLAAALGPLACLAAALGSLACLN